MRLISESLRQKLLAASAIGIVRRYRQHLGLPPAPQQQHEAVATESSLHREKAKGAASC